MNASYALLMHVRGMEYLCICSLCKYKFTRFFFFLQKSLGFFGSVTAVGETQCDLQNSQKDLGRAEVVIKL